MRKPSERFVPSEVVIDDRTWNSDQSWHRHLIVMRGARRIRYCIRVNAYKEQSYATADVWANDAWSEVHRIAGVLLGTQASYVDRTVKPSAFDGDIDALRNVVIGVLES
jgi:hypothetical protein